MNHFEIIRRKVLLDGMSQREVAQELGHSRRTVAKALENPVPPGYQMSKPRGCPVMDRHREAIEQWLEADRTAPPKQRHTAQRIYERLCEERQFTGDEGTVRRFVARLKVQQPKEAFMPLLFEAGEEGQVDWGEAKMIENGVERTVQLFCMRLSHSKASFVHPYERATLEAFLDGHVRAFEFFGGVPRRLAYDNLRSAVIRVGRGRERELNARFVQFRSWYLFDTRFCNVESGNEKGDVENLVKRSQRTYLTPVPEVTGMAALAQKLREDCERDLQKVDDRQELSRGQLLEGERARFLPLPAAAFPACREEATHVSKQLLVRFDGNDYSVPAEHAHRSCVVRGFVEQVQIEVGHERVACHRRSYGQGQFVLEPAHYLKLLERKPGSLDNARPFKAEHLEGGWGVELLAMRKELEYRQPGGAGTRQFIEILQLSLQYPMPALRRAVGACVERRAYSVAAVLNVLRNQPQRPAVRLDLSGRRELVDVGDGMRPLSAYDRLLGPGGGSSCRGGGAVMSACNTVLLESHLKTLRLPTFVKEYAKAARQSGERGDSHESFLEHLAELEVNAREAKASLRRLRQAGFPVDKDLSDFDFAAVPGLSRKKVLDLFACRFIAEKASVILLGAPGVGKSHLAIALGREACRHGRRVKFFTASHLVNTYLEAREQRQVMRLEAHIRKKDLIIVDELGYLPMDQRGAEHLFSFFSQCYEQVSLVVTTNLPFAEWPGIFAGDARLAGAVIDRLTHRVHIVEIQGESYRLRQSLKSKEGGAGTADAAQ